MTESAESAEAIAKTGTKTRVRGICRYCAVSCGVFMESEDGRVVSSGAKQRVSAS